MSFKVKIVRISGGFSWQIVLEDGHLLNTGKRFKQKQSAAMNAEKFLLKNGVDIKRIEFVTLARLPRFYMDPEKNPFAVDAQPKITNEPH